MLFKGHRLYFTLPVTIILLIGAIVLYCTGHPWYGSLVTIITFFYFLHFVENNYYCYMSKKELIIKKEFRFVKIQYTDIREVRMFRHYLLLTYISGNKSKRTHLFPKNKVLLKEKLEEAMKGIIDEHII